MRAAADVELASTHRAGSSRPLIAKSQACAPFSESFRSKRAAGSDLVHSSSGVGCSVRSGNPGVLTTTYAYRPSFTARRHAGHVAIREEVRSALLIARYCT